MTIGRFLAGQGSIGRVPKDAALKSQGLCRRTIFDYTARSTTPLVDACGGVDQRVSRFLSLALVDGCIASRGTSLLIPTAIPRRLIATANRLILAPDERAAARKIVPPRLRIPLWKGLGADSEEKHEPASDIDTAVVDSLKVLDPKRPIREAEVHLAFLLCRRSANRRHAKFTPSALGSVGWNEDVLLQAIDFLLADILANLLIELCPRLPWPVFLQLSRHA